MLNIPHMDTAPLEVIPKSISSLLIAQHLYQCVRTVRARAFKDDNPQYIAYQLTADYDPPHVTRRRSIQETTREHNPAFLIGSSSEGFRYRYVD